MRMSTPTRSPCSGHSQLCSTADHSPSTGRAQRTRARLHIFRRRCSRRPEPRSYLGTLLSKQHKVAYELPFGIATLWRCKENTHKRHPRDHSRIPPRGTPHPWAPRPTSTQGGSSPPAPRAARHSAQACRARCASRHKRCRPARDAARPRAARAAPLPHLPERQAPAHHLRAGARRRPPRAPRPPPEPRRPALPQRAPPARGGVRGAPTAARPPPRAPRPLRATRSLLRALQVLPRGAPAAPRARCRAHCTFRPRGAPAAPRALRRGARSLLRALHLLAARHAVLLVAALVRLGAVRLGILPPRAQLLLHVLDRPHGHLRARPARHRPARAASSPAADAPSCRPVRASARVRPRRQARKQGAHRGTRTRGGLPE